MSYAQILAGTAEPPPHAADIAEPSDLCGCHGNGRRIRADGGAGVAVRCDCLSPLSENDVRHRMHQAGMAGREISMAYEPWDARWQPKPVAPMVWLEWVLHGAEGEAPGELGDPESPQVFTLLGTTGQGKTKLAAELVRRWIELEGRSPKWANCIQAVEIIGQERAETGRSPYWQRLVKAGLLVLDDMSAAVLVKPGAAEQIPHLIYMRHRDERPSIYTSNILALSTIQNHQIRTRLAGGVRQLLDVIRGGKRLPDYRTVKSCQVR